MIPPVPIMRWTNILPVTLFCNGGCGACPKRRTGPLPLYPLIYPLSLFTELVGLLLVSCDNAGGHPAGRMGITEAEEATFSCGEYGFGMGLGEPDLPMVRCTIEKSQGKEGRTELLNGMMQDEIYSSNPEAVARLLDTGVDAPGEGPFGELFLLAAITNLTFLDHGTGPMGQREEAVAVAEILVEEGTRVSDSPGENL